MDLMLSQLESLIHYTSICLMTIQSELSHTCLMPLDATLEPYASFWLQELHVVRRVVTLMAVRGLPHRLPGPLWALSPQFITAELDGNKAHITVLHSMKEEDCEDLMAAKHAGFPWKDAWWQPGTPLLAAGYASRSMDEFAQVANFRPSFHLGQLPVLHLRLMRRELTEAYKAGRRALLDMEHRLSHALARLLQMADAFSFEALILAAMDGRSEGMEHDAE
ncbi:hypothetical protein PAXRUDRAFT_20693 [Paxillus rubicundulus Ve08.2h10]|uniref:Uncharacterized protein n=1 Tax=Paxillus rubicundulus Ve08.2h10 TaxID=930991 RepID=A0A0D0CRY0_9AGAM|nr:hypothetical protein PAXRUDRAFT_20693 [Paxillus rubicundulus Ve08.2h10]